MSMSVALYALADGLRRPELTLGRLRTHAEGKGWTIAAEFWDPVPEGYRPIGQQMLAGWGSARTAALRREVDVLVVARLEDVAPTVGDADDLSAWAADHQVPILAVETTWRGTSYRMGPDPARLLELRHDPPPAIGTRCCRLPPSPCTADPTTTREIPIHVH